MACGEAAAAAAGSLAAAPDAVIDRALRGMAGLLTERSAEILAANVTDMAGGERAGLGRGLLDRLRLDRPRLADMARQIGLLAEAPFPPDAVPVRDLPGGLRLTERRVPVGVIGANFEARPNVTIDIASQLLKSRNAGVLRTGERRSGRPPHWPTTCSGPRWPGPGWIRPRCSWSARRTGTPRSSWSASPG